MNGFLTSCRFAHCSMKWAVFSVSFLHIGQRELTSPFLANPLGMVLYNKFWITRETPNRILPNLAHLLILCVLTSVLCEVNKELKPNCLGMIIGRSSTNFMFFAPFGVESALVGVDVCTGLIWFDDIGLEIDVSDKTLNWFVVLKTMEKQNDL